MEAVISEETAILRENRVVELTEFNHRKRQGLLEINRVLRNLAASELASVERARMLRLMAKLEENQQMLTHHLKAVDEIANLVARAIQESESDGTYGRCGA